jgi:hypothetical protein
MNIRRREFRVRLRSDRVGHDAVMNWLDALERNDRGVAGLQDHVIAVLAAHVEAMGHAAASPRRSPKASLQVAPPPRQRDSVVATTAVERPDPLQIATERLNF